MYGTPVGVSIHAVQEGQKGALAFKDRLPLGLAKTFRHGEQHGCQNVWTVLHAWKSLLSLR